MKALRVSRMAFVLAAVLLTGLLPSAEAADPNAGVVELKVGRADWAAAKSASHFRSHILPAPTKAGRRALLNEPRPPLTEPEPELSSQPDSFVPSLPGGEPFQVPSFPAPGFYPADLGYFGGQVVTSAASINVYVNCANATCWGHPALFLNDLGNSQFIHLVDQYVGVTWGPRYTVGTRFTFPAAGVTFFSSFDILAIVHAAATAPGGGNGYNHIIHVFLPAGTDTCSDPANTNCYSPDNLSTFAFCAYHASFVFPDVGETLFTVEPFQDVPGCALPNFTANGQEIDSTNSTLSHELFETITDPDFFQSWFGYKSVPEFDQEIGDECQKLDGAGKILTLNSHVYAVQLEYSNYYHACASSP